MYTPQSIKFINCKRLFKVERCNKFKTWFNFIDISAPVKMSVETSAILPDFTYFLKLFNHVVSIAVSHILCFSMVEFC